MIDITLRDLETTHQRENETFSEFLIKWRAKASKMMNRPKEKDQVNMVMKGLLPVYYNRIFASPLLDFKQLCNVCITHQGSLPHRRRLSEVQARRQTFKPILTLFNRINININVLLNINIKMHIHIQDKALNLRCILSITKVFEHMCKRVISNLWIQLHILILSRRIGTQICIASSIRRQDIVPMSVLN